MIINWKDIAIRCLKTLNEIAYMKRNSYNSYHFAVDDVEAYQSTKLILENLDSRLTL